MITRERTREVQRLEKLLEDTGIKLSSVASGITGVSGRAMLEALIAGQRDPAVLAELAQAADATEDPSADRGADRTIQHPPCVHDTTVSGSHRRPQRDIARLDARIEQAMQPFVRPGTCWPASRAFPASPLKCSSPRPAPT